MAVIGTATAVLIDMDCVDSIGCLKASAREAMLRHVDRFVNYVSGLMLGAWMMGVIFSWMTLNMVVAAIAVVVLSASFLRFVFIDSSSEL